MLDSLQDLHILAGMAQSLAEQLRESWPVQGQSPPEIGPPTNAAASNIVRHLVHLQTVLFRFEPPTNPEAGAVWLQTRLPVLLPDTVMALERIKLICNHLADQLGLREAIANTIDGQPKCVLMPTLNTAQFCQLPNGRPLPTIDRADIRGLEWAARKLSQALGVSPTSQEQAEKTATDTAEPEAPARHSLDFRSVHWFGTDYSFTVNQAACVKKLWEAWENRTPDVAGYTLTAEADIETMRLDHLFRKHPAWKTMIVSGKTKGTYRLAPLETE